MTELLTAVQMRAIEQAAINSGETTGRDLMERAGQGVVTAVFDEWPELATRLWPGAKAPHDASPEGGDQLRAVVLCGPGNNGGDGFVVARLLHQNGADVEVYLYGDPDKLPPDATANRQLWEAMGDVRSWPKEDALDSIITTSRPTDILVDAVFGKGLKRALQADLYAVTDAFLGQQRQPYVRPVVAIDLPSGLCSDSGRELGYAVASDLTVSFHSAKRGHYLGNGPEYCGRVKVVSIGLSDVADRKSPARKAIEELVRSQKIGKHVTDRVTPPLSPYLSKGDSEHKYMHGHALVLAGRPGKGGAARLAARAALRVGAGLVTVGCPNNAVPENAAQLNAIMIAGFDGPAELDGLLQDKRLNALCLGPGLGLTPATEDLVRHALAANLATVLDADALSLFESNPQRFFDMTHDKCVLTPHSGEFARLFPDIAQELNTPALTGPAYSKVDATRDAAARAGCVVLFKGPDTVIADPTGRTSVNASLYDRAAPWLATAGSGDVLAGLIAGLLARGLGPFQASENAAWLHTECARSFGPGLIAEDLPEQLPKVLRALEI